MYLLKFDQKFSKIRILGFNKQSNSLYETATRRHSLTYFTCCHFVSMYNNNYLIFSYYFTFIALFTSFTKQYLSVFMSIFRSIMYINKWNMYIIIRIIRYWIFVYDLRDELLLLINIVLLKQNYDLLNYVMSIPFKIN